MSSSLEGTLKLLEDRGCTDEEPKQEAQAWLERRRWAGPRRVNGRGLELRGQEGREGHMGDECGAGMVDERVYLLSLFAAGLHLKHTTEKVMEGHFSNTFLASRSLPRPASQCDPGMGEDSCWVPSGC